MTPIVEFMDIMVAAVEKNCSLDYIIRLDELPAEGGLYAEPGEGFTETVYFDKTEVNVVPVLILSRNPDLKKCIGQLETICNYLQKLKEYPPGETFSWMDTEIAKYPSKIGRDEDGTYHGSCILNCKLYF